MLNSCNQLILSNLVSHFFACADLHTEQNFFEKVKQLAQSQEAFFSQTQEYVKLKEEFAKLGKTKLISV